MIPLRRGSKASLNPSPTYWRVADPEALLEASPEGPAVQPTPANNNETNTIITSHVNPFFKNILLESKASLVNSFIWRCDFNEMFLPVKLFFEKLRSYHFFLLSRSLNFLKI